MAERLPPIGFWSYARQDDEMSGGKLSALRSLLMSELQQQYGRQPIKIFQDVSAIPPGAEWEVEITAALNNATFLIPIITPAFIQSEFCCREIEIFLEREQRLRESHRAVGTMRRIFPVLYVKIDGIEPDKPAVLDALSKLQWLDFREFRHKEYRSEAVRTILAQFAEGICQLLQTRVEPAPSEAEAAEEARLTSEARRAEAVRLEAETRAREETERQRAREAAGRAREEAERRTRAAEQDAQADAERLAAERSDEADRARAAAHAGENARQPGAAGPAEQATARGLPAMRSWVKAHPLAAWLGGLAIALVIVLAMGSTVQQGNSPTVGGGAPFASDIPGSGQPWNEVVAETPEGGYRMGNPDAPAQLVEYRSLTCDHCAEFASAADPELLAAVQTGRLSWEIRGYTRNATDMALELSARCAGKAGYLAASADILARQSVWLPRAPQLFNPGLMSDDPEVNRIRNLPFADQMQALLDKTGLRPVLNARGLSDASLQRCMSDIGQANQLVNANRYAAATYNIMGVPAFILNRQIVMDNGSFVTDWQRLRPQLAGIVPLAQE